MRVVVPKSFSSSPAQPSRFFSLKGCLRHFISQGERTYRVCHTSLTGLGHRVSWPPFSRALLLYWTTQNLPACPYPGSFAQLLGFLAPSLLSPHGSPCRSFEFKWLACRRRGKSPLGLVLNFSAKNLTVISSSHADQTLLASAQHLRALVSETPANFCATIRLPFAEPANL